MTISPLLLSNHLSLCSLFHSFPFDAKPLFCPPESFSSLSCILQANIPRSACSLAFHMHREQILEQFNALRTSMFSLLFLSPSITPLTAIIVKNCVSHYPSAQTARFVQITPYNMIHTVYQLQFHFHSTTYFCKAFTYIEVNFTFSI